MIPTDRVPPDPSLAHTHYENFPVASWLCPAHLRAPISAIYAFARVADDIADEGDAPAQQRLQDLTEMLEDLHLCAAWPANSPAGGAIGSKRWPQVFEPLGQSIRQFKLPMNLLEDLLDAFVQDVRKTRDATGYKDGAELLDYCRRSANPVGRLLLHLYGVSEPTALRMSDQICSALQLINFWQDLSLDIPRGRHYLPQQDCAEFGVAQADLLALKQTQNATKLISACTMSAGVMMRNGSHLCKLLPRRAGWELRLVVQGGLRILDKIKTMNHATLIVRPALNRWDIFVMAWRAVWM